MTKSLRILCDLNFPTETHHIWDGSGPYVDADGNVYRSCVLKEGALDQIEAAINGEAVRLQIAVAGVGRERSDLTWEDVQNGNVLGSTIKIMTQECDEHDQPIAGVEPEIEFQGIIDNVKFDDAATETDVVSTVAIECVNRFSLRNVTSGSVLSDRDQQARSAILNPGANPDRFAERVPALAEKTVNWPAFN